MVLAGNLYESTAVEVPVVHSHIVGIDVHWIGAHRFYDVSDNFIDDQELSRGSCWDLCGATGTDMGTATTVWLTSDPTTFVLQLELSSILKMIIDNWALRYTSWIQMLGGCKSA